MARVHAAAELAEAAHLDVAELRVIERLPFDVLVAELQEVVEEVARALAADRLGRVALLLLQQRAVEVLPAVPQLVTVPDGSVVEVAEIGPVPEQWARARGVTGQSLVLDGGGVQS